MYFHHYVDDRIKKMQLKIAQWGTAVKTVFSRCTDVCRWRSNRPFCFCRPRALKCAVKHLFWPGKKTHVWKCTRAHTVNSWTGLFLPDIFWEWRLNFQLILFYFFTFPTVSCLPCWVQEKAPARRCPAGRTSSEEEKWSGQLESEGKR